MRNEFGPLEEVIVGIPLSPDDRVFEWQPGMDEEFSWIKPHTFNWLKENSGVPWKDADPELFAKINEQVANFADVLTSAGVTVRRPDRLRAGDHTYINIGTEQVWPRDVWCTAGDIVAVSSLRMPWKRKQQFSMLPFYTDLMAADGCRLVSTPQASTEILSHRSSEVEHQNVLLDGGDFFVVGDEILLGQGHGSNALGAKFAELVWHDEFTVRPLTLSAAALHLDCTIALLRPGLGIICREWLVSDLPESIRDWEWIEATEQEAAWLGVNGVALDPETYLMDPAHERLVAEVRARGHNVIEVPYDGPSYLGGSLRCSTQPVRRASL